VILAFRVTLKTLYRLSAGTTVRELLSLGQESGCSKKVQDEGDNGVENARYTNKSEKSINLFFFILSKLTLEIKLSLLQPLENIRIRTSTSLFILEKWSLEQTPVVEKKIINQLGSYFKTIKICHIT